MVYNIYNETSFLKNIYYDIKKKLQKPADGGGGLDARV